MALIDYPNTWDALRIVQNCEQSIWDGIMALEGINDTITKVPAHVADGIFERQEYKFLQRVHQRILQQPRD